MEAIRAKEIADEVNNTDYGMVLENITKASQDGKYSTLCGMALRQEVLDKLQRAGYGYDVNNGVTKITW